MGKKNQSYRAIIYEVLNKAEIADVMRVSGGMDLFRSNINRAVHYQLRVNGKTRTRLHHIRHYRSPFYKSGLFSDHCRVCCTRESVLNFAKTWGIYALQQARAWDMLSFIV